MSRGSQFVGADWPSDGTERRGVSRFSSTRLESPLLHPFSLCWAIVVSVRDSRDLEKMVFSQTLRRAAAQSAGAYRSPFAPKYQSPLHFQGLTVNTATKYAKIAGTFGVSAGVFLVFFLGEVPRVRKDILQQFPFFDKYFDRTIAPEDNPF
ncbi:cytochrome b-c1 complex subunit 10 [Aspergillus tanneri]|uniref:Uncharacterized protein n=1 Tax=Aspergillus tanneri TaxID=1220188 RepID=A0A5M9MYY5_9EURO|nr:uncharacterized protein ATNIH1004_003257 [Aspergillus tanneri]KAA8650570.1 hypothetical protein ATNIH1004_003257 [Aspergillus tanneri]